MILAVDLCTFEAIPDKETSKEIRDELCKNEKARQSIYKCLKEKKKEVSEHIKLDKNGMMKKANSFKRCIADVLNKT